MPKTNAANEYIDFKSKTAVKTCNHWENFCWADVWSLYQWL